MILKHIGNIILELRDERKFLLERIKKIDYTLDTLDELTNRPPPRTDTNPSQKSAGDEIAEGERR